MRTRANIATVEGSVQDSYHDEIAHIGDFNTLVCFSAAVWESRHTLHT